MNINEIDSLFKLDPYQSYIVADGLSNSIVGSLKRSPIGQNIRFDESFYKRLECWFESRFWLDQVSHDESFYKLFGIKLSSLDYVVNYNDDNTYFLDRHLFYNERYTTYITNSLNKILEKYGITISSERSYQLLLSCFIKTANLTSHKNKHVKDIFLSTHNNIVNLMDCFIHMYKIALYEDQKQMYYNENIYILSFLISKTSVAA